MSPASSLVVVGAGPIGSFAALKAAEHGIETSIYEEHASVGEPDHCTGHLSIRGLQQLRLNIPDRVIEKRIRRYEFFSPSGKNLSIEFPRPQTVIVNRALFDTWLSHAAEKKGVTYHKNSRIEALRYDKNNGLTFISKSGNSFCTERTKLLIDAEGYPPALLIKEGYVSSDFSNQVIGIQVKCDKITGCDDQCVEVYLGSQYADGFYAWIAPFPDGSAKVGLASRRQDPRILLKRFMQKHPVASKKLAGAKSSQPILHALPLAGPSSKTCWPHLIAVGDAASQVKATTGGGVVMGLFCAQSAGETAAAAILKDDPYLLEAYEKSWRRIVGLDLKWMMYFRRLLNMIPDTMMDRLFSAIAKPGTSDLFRSIDLNFQGASMLKSLGEGELRKVLFRLFARFII